MRYRHIWRITVVEQPNAMVDFPSAGAQSQSEPPLPLPQHLPFRRISFPTSAGNMPLRPTSIVSTASFDSTDTSLPPPSFPSPSKSSPRGPRHRLISNDVNRRQSRRREVKSAVIDEQRDAKRRKIIQEFCETERTYVEGLELIYSVSTQHESQIFSVNLSLLAFSYAYHRFTGQAASAPRS